MEQRISTASMARWALVMFAVCLLGSGSALAQGKGEPRESRGGGGILIDNGVSGDGAWAVEVLAGGDTEFGELDAVDFAPEDLIYEFNTYVDDGDDGSFVPLSATTVTSPPTLTDTAEVTSSGSFTGPNGQIDWTAVAAIPAGEATYQVTLTFESASAFGDVRVINYFDQDILGASDDVMIVLGTPGASNFQILTLDDTDDLGIGHFADYAPDSATYAGFAADEFSELRSAISGGTATFSVGGDINTTLLPPLNDPRYPGEEAYGPADITDAYAFDLDPGSTQATLAFSLGGSISGEPIGPEPGGESLSVNTLSPVGLALLMLVMAVAAFTTLVGRRCF
ncbi:hypothetical protein [Wenzhouxiangella sp. EGI_FJ10409]|uniref:hypothetical protein n=1 Tax=Wenzhouxiangella sp. EGI_FJ10409 TaxID=3243767 RepID=UPI0035E09337